MKQPLRYFAAYAVLVIVIAVALYVQHTLIVLNQEVITYNTQQVAINCQAMKATSEWVQVLARTSTTLFAKEQQPHSSLLSQRKHADDKYLSQLGVIKAASHCTELKKASK